MLYREDSKTFLTGQQTEQQDKQTKKQYYRRVVNDVIFSDGLLTFLKLTQTLVFISGR